MTDTNTPPNPEETPNNTSKGPSKKTIAGIAALLILLLAAALFWSKSNNARQAERLLTIADARHQSDSLYQELKQQLAVYKQENQELYAQIARKEAELEQQYSKIKRLIAQASRDKKDRKAIQSKLEALSSELGGMREYVEKQTMNLEELREENLRLKRERKELDEQYAQELALRKSIAQQGADLQKANEEMQKQLRSAAVLQTTNVNTVGLRLKNNGERKGINVAKRTELIEVCFDIVRNEVVDEGPNRFHLRLIDPNGKVVQDAERGSGKLELFDGSGSIKYTTSKIFDYNTSVKNLCLEWFAYPNTPFLAGTYKIELYNKGRLSGSYNFNTK
ncbi:MAG: hypothetical protein AB8E82_11090 [Aureispira sp.]